MTRTISVPAHYYQQFDADYRLEVPGEGYGGWKRTAIELSADHTAVVVMHAWDIPPYERTPGEWRAVEYIPRSLEILRRVFPPLLAAVRRSPLKLFHVVGGPDYYSKYPGYQRVQRLTPPAPPAPAGVEPDAALRALQAFRGRAVFVGEHNAEDVRQAFGAMTDFPAEARPVGDEPIAENADQLLAICRDQQVNHLIYCGFAINWCLLMSPGGMLDMSRRGAMCSAIRQATTAVECRETARAEGHKEEGLWRTALAFGFVFDAEDLIARWPASGVAAD